VKQSSKSTRSSRYGVVLLGAPALVSAALAASALAASALAVSVPAFAARTAGPHTSSAIPGIHPRLNWAVGYSQNGTKADINQILHWNGTKWLAN
jgi:hypothetical protein